MASWREFETAAPELATMTRRLWPGTGPLLPISYLATVRPDGGPRLHPFCPILAGGRLFAAIPPTSPKGDDLRRDPRCTIHAQPGPDDDELCLRAQAHELSDAASLQLIRDAVATSGVGGMIESVAHHPLFELDLERVDLAYWVGVGQAGTHAVRHRWSAP